MSQNQYPLGENNIRAKIRVLSITAGEESQFDKDIVRYLSAQEQLIVVEKKLSEGEDLYFSNTSIMQAEVILLILQKLTEDNLDYIINLKALSPEKKLLLITEDAQKIGRNQYRLRYADKILLKSTSKEEVYPMPEDILANLMLLAKKSYANITPQYENADQQYLSVFEEEETYTVARDPEYTMPGPHLRIPSPFVPQVIAIGASAGGPDALLKLIKNLPAEIDQPVLIVQHMPKEVTSYFARQVQLVTPRPTFKAKHDMELAKGHIYIAPSDHHMIVEKKENRVYISLTKGPHENYCRPSIDPLFRSIAQLYKNNALGIILTGMGKDGLNGSKAIIENGGSILAQDQDTSLVWGMPGAVVDEGLVCGIYPIDDMHKAIVGLCFSDRGD